MIDDDYLRASQIKNLMILSQSSDIIFQIKHILLIKQKVWLTYIYCERQGGPRFPIEDKLLSV